jgi:hypothetical protein
MKNFMVLYEMPAAQLQEWMKKPEADRKAEEEKVKGEWDAWLAGHAASVLNTVAVGKSKRVTAQGIEDASNGIMLSSYVQAESAEAAAKLFAGHPHLSLPSASIEVMETWPLEAV